MFDVSRFFGYFFVFFLLFETMYLKADCHIAWEQVFRSKIIDSSTQQANADDTQPKDLFSINNVSEHGLSEALLLSVKT